MAEYVLGTMLLLPNYHGKEVINNVCVGPATSTRHCCLLRSMGKEGSEIEANVACPHHVS
jgi:hypothetical protein